MYSLNYILKIQEAHNAEIWCLFLLSRYSQYKDNIKLVSGRSQHVSSNKNKFNLWVLWPWMTKKINNNVESSKLQNSLCIVFILLFVLIYISSYILNLWIKSSCKWYSINHLNHISLGKEIQLGSKRCKAKWRLRKSW